MKNNKYINFTKKWILFLVVGFSVASCDSFLEADAPTSSLTSNNVFVSDGTATSAVSGMYAYMMSNSDPYDVFSGGLGVMTGLTSDELNDNNLIYQDYQKNQLITTGNTPLYYMWSNTYKYIYQANACIIGITDNTNMSTAVQNQLLGESYFIRAISYFYLTNLYGDVPLITGLDYQENMTKSRTPSAEIYLLIQSDLEKAENLLTANYPSANRARPNKFTAKALSARVNLYLKKYQIAKDKASEVIAGDYALSTVQEVFKIPSRETIWQLAAVSNTFRNTYDGKFYSAVYAARPTYTILDNLYNTFEAGDTRKSNWIANYTYNATVYHYPNKYTRVVETTTPTEYNIVFRLAEQYLIRAEAEANLGNLGNAVTDLNKIRTRANLGGYTGALTEEAILSAIAHERRTEFFAEHGHRWFDLKRTNTIDAVLGTLKPTWKTTAKLWPVPQNEINANINLLPNNDGY